MLNARRFDPFSRGMYVAFLLWGWLLYAFSSVVQILGAEVGFTAAQIGLHGTALAVGTALAGVVLTPTVRAIGRRGTLVLGAALIIVGCIGLVTLTALPATLGASLILAIGGNLAIAAGQAGLVIHHDPFPADAVTTANGLGTLVGLLGPVAIGASVAAGFGWRPVVAVTVPLSLAAVVVWLRMRASPGMTPRGVRARPMADPAAPPARGGLPAAGWWFLLAALFGVAIENATTFWSLTLIAERTDAGTAVAAAATAAFVGGMAGSRLVSFWFTARWTAAQLVVAAFVVSALGWLVLWLTTQWWVAIIGLAISGMGCGLLYPFAASLMLTTARGSKDAAQGMIMVALGIAVGVVPFVLGVLADAFGVHMAFTIIPMLALGGAVATWLGVRMSARPTRR